MIKNNEERIQKVLAQHGIGSRRQIEQLIKRQQITVNGTVATLGCKIISTDIVAVAGKKFHLPDRVHQTKTRILLYHKPIGEVCSRKDPERRKTVFDSLPFLKGERWITVGRLDINTSGLLLFTNNGDVANKLMHPSANITRKYAVRIFGQVSTTVAKKLLEGVVLEDGLAKFDTLDDAGGQGMNHWYNVTLTEGRNREIRRLWQSQGFQVSRIIRIQFGSLLLPRSVREGKFIELSEKEVNRLVAVGC